MGFSDYQVNKWLTELGDLWLALHFDNPDIAGAYASEVFGGSYVRMSAAMTDASSRAIFTLTTVKFSGLPAVSISHLAAWDAKTNGNLIASVALPTAVRILPGTSYTVPAATLALSID